VGFTGFSFLVNHLDTDFLQSDLIGFLLIGVFQGRKKEKHNVGNFSEFWQDKLF